jgi:hypothetical protein
VTLRTRPFDSRTLRHTLRFGEFDAPLADADVAQLHDTLTRIHLFPGPDVRRLRAQLRRMVLDDADGRQTLDLDREDAWQVQLAVFCDQSARIRVSPALYEARVQAFHFLESQPTEA